jgi:small-conductance mechanosensitive channel
MLEDGQKNIETYLQYFGDNTYLQAVVIVAFSWMVAWLVNRVVMIYLKKHAEKIKFIDNYLLDSLQSPLVVSIVLIGFGSAISVVGVSDTIRPIAFSVLKMIALLYWTVFIMRLFRTVLNGISNNNNVNWLNSRTLPLFENLASVVIVIFAVYFLFSIWNIDMTAWLASAGIVGIAVGFAAKDTLANLFSGVFIVADAPYKIGDYINLEGGERGKVTKIGLRSTRLLTRDDVEVTVPNSVIGNNKISNESAGPYEKSRIRVPVGVAYGSDIDVVRAILEEVADQEPESCDFPAPRVRMRRFGPSSLDFDLLCWISQPEIRGRVIDSLYRAIYKKFVEQGIEIPYSKQDLYIKELPDGRRDHTDT